MTTRPTAMQLPPSVLLRTTEIGRQCIGYNGNNSNTFAEPEAILADFKPHGRDLSAILLSIFRIESEMFGNDAQQILFYRFGIHFLEYS